MNKIQNFFLRNLKIKYRMMILNIFLLFIPFLILMLIFSREFLKIVQKNVIESQQTTCYQFNNQLGDIISRIKNTGATVAGNATLNDILSNGDATWLQQNTNKAEVQSFLAVVQSNISKNKITDIKIYIPEDSKQYNQCGESGNNTFVNISEIENNYWKNNMDAENYQSAIYSGADLSDSERTNSGDIAYVQKIMYIKNRQTCTAYLVIYHSTAEIVSDMSDKSIMKNVVSYLLDEDGKQIAWSDAEDKSILYISGDKLKTLVDTQGIFASTKILGKEYFLTYRQIEGTDWDLVWIISKKTVNMEIYELLKMLYIIGTGIFILVFIIGNIISGNIVKRIYELKNNMQVLRENIPQKMFVEQGNDEIGELVETYNYMVDRIRFLTKQEKETQEELNEIKIDALRSQVNPHFLYNTLDMIMWLAKAGKIKEVEDSVITLSRFYRMSLNKGNFMTTVEQELIHVNLYMKLINRRFDQNIFFDQDVPDEMAEYEIPMFLLQPFVENAIIHGIQEKEIQTGNIVILGWLEKEWICFQICDDGVGMTKQQIQTIFEKKGNTTGSGIGVRNTYYRLYMKYRVEECIHYESKVGEGTTVEIRIPIQNKEINDEAI